MVYRRHYKNYARSRQPTSRTRARANWKRGMQAIRRNKYAANRYQSSRAPFRAIGTSLSGTGFPPKLNVKLLYAETISFVNIAPDTVGQQLYRLNSISQPYVTGGASTTSSSNHQPQFHDTYKSIYKFYDVRAVKYKVVFTPRHTSTTDARTLFFTKVDPSASSVFTPLKQNEIMEDPNVKWKAAINYTAGNLPKVISGYVKIKKHQHHSHNNIAEFESVPANQIMLNVGFFNGQTGANTSVDAQITLKYYVQLSETLEGGTDEQPE